MISPDGRIVSDSSRFTVDLASLESDQARRDNYVRRMTLKTDSFPSASFVPRSVTGLPAQVQAGREYNFRITGDLMLVGVTKPAVWMVKAQRSAAGAIVGTATTSFNFAEYGIAVPKVRSVLSVDDLITLEYDFTLVPRSASTAARDTTR